MHINKVLDPEEEIWWGRLFEKDVVDIELFFDTFFNNFTDNV